MIYRHLAIATLTLIAACASSQTEPEAPPQPPAPVEPEPLPSAEATSTCPLQMSFDGSFDRDAEPCREGIERISSVAQANHTCRQNEDCMIYQPAGGCMGIAISRAGEPLMEPLPRSCVGPESSCWEGDFSNYLVHCHLGCCFMDSE